MSDDLPPIDGDEPYHEYNLAPSGEWALFAFDRYREVSSLGEPAQAPRIALRTHPDRLELHAELPLDRLSPDHAGAALRVALSAVIEEHDGTLSYWSLQHPPGKPDFHHADAFALRLPAR